MDIPPAMLPWLATVAAPSSDTEVETEPCAGAVVPLAVLAVPGAADEAGEEELVVDEEEEAWP